MTYLSTKTWGHEVGLSCAFRQWRATHSHCQYLHGYALAIRVVFASPTLDERNWVVDFGGLGKLRDRLRQRFDHKTVVASDDPHLDWFHEGEERGLLDLVVLESVGCEAFAKLVFGEANYWLFVSGLEGRCRVVEVEVREHGANSALYRPEEP